MLEITQLHDYQKKAVNYQCDKKNTALWLDMGLGKTIITLTSIRHLIDTGFLSGVIIVGPVRVVRAVWRQEAAKWRHTKDMSFSMMVGTPDQRTRALMRKADIHLINYENLGWLADTIKTYFTDQGAPAPFQGIVFDELSLMKNSTTIRVKSYLKIEDSFKWTTGLTGTPAGNGLGNLHGQYLVLDKGQRLGRYKTQFETNFMTKGRYNQLKPLPSTKERILALVKDMTLSMSAEDYNPLPDILVNDIWIDFSPKDRLLYDKMERDFLIEIEDTTVELVNHMSLMNKCFQFSNGAIYVNPETREWKKVHDAKLDALESIIEEAQGRPVLCSYAYVSDAERIMNKFKKLRPVNMTDCKTDATIEDAKHRWKTGDCPLMLGQAGSMGHGLDGLQYSGNIIVWFGLNWSLDLYMQMNARIRRQGQAESVICHRILTKDTFDEIQCDRLEGKDKVQKDLRYSVSEYAKRKYKGGINGQ